MNPKKIFKIKIICGLIIVALMAFIKFIVTVNKDNIIISSGLQSYKTYNAVTMAIAVIAALLLVFVIVRYLLKNKPVDEKLPDLNIKKGITKPELLAKLNGLIESWSKKDGEYLMSVPYLENAKVHFTKIDSIYNTLTLLVENNNEGSLDEVRNVIKTVEQQLVSNTVGMLNHIFLEISIDGFDTTNISKYIENSDSIINECSKLLKTAVIYMDGKGNEQGISEYIKSMIETLNKLKGELV